jgi:hypothetical protein
MTRRPNLFIVGAPKTGTTSLYTYLDAHPDIYMSPIKEPNYFSPDVRGTFRRSPFDYPQDTQRYLDLFAEARDEKYLGEASTSYLVSREAPRLVQQFAPDARIVAMLRHPVDLMYSLHNERVSNGGEPITDFAAAVLADDERRQGRGLPVGFNALGAVYRDTALLGEQLKRWMDTFGREQIHPIVFSDFSSDTPRVYRRLLEFLGVDSAFRPPSFRVLNRSWRRRDGIVTSVTRSGPAQWVRHRALPAVAGETGAFTIARRFTRSRLYRREHIRPDLSPELRKELADSFAEDVELLSRLIGRNLLSEWLERPVQHDAVTG